MKKLNILIPIATMGTLGAVVTPMTVLTSCGGGSSKPGSGKDADLTKGYTPSVSPAAKKVYKGSTGEADALKDYLAEMGVKDSGFTNLEEDVRFSYAEAFKTETFKSMGFVFDSYKLDFDDMTITTSTSCKINTKFLATATGSYHNDEYDIHVTEGNFHAIYQFHEPFDVTFHKADDTTWLKMNYFAFVPDPEYLVTYTLTGSFKYNGELIQCPGVEVPEHHFLDSSDVFGFVTDLLIIEGLTCNLKTWAEKGVVYTHYYQNMEFQV